MSLAIQNTPLRNPAQSIRRIYNRPADVPVEPEPPKKEGFSFWRALKNFGKGLVSPVTTMFSSPKNFLIGAGMIIGGIALIAATGGAAAPVLLGIGLGIGAVQATAGAYKVGKAVINGDAKQAEEAFYDFGAATSTIGLSVIGAKGSLKPLGISTAGMSRTQATLACVKAMPTSLGQSKTAFISGAWRSNLHTFGQSLATTGSAACDSFRDGTWKTNIKHYFANLSKKNNNQTQEVSQGSTTQTQDPYSDISYQRAQERYGLRVVADENLPQNGGRTIISNSTNGRRARISLSRGVQKALADPNHPDHLRALRVFYEEVAHSHQSPINPIRPNGTKMRFSEYTARRGLQELVARSVGRAKAGGPKNSALVKEVADLISKGRYKEAARLLSRNGIDKSYIFDYIRDYKANVRANGRWVAQRSNSTSTIDTPKQLATKYGAMPDSEQSNQIIRLINKAGDQGRNFVEILIKLKQLNDGNSVKGVDKLLHNALRAMHKGDYLNGYYWEAKSALTLHRKGYTLIEFSANKINGKDIPRSLANNGRPLDIIAVKDGRTYVFEAKTSPRALRYGYDKQEIEHVVNSALENDAVPTIILENGPRDISERALIKKVLREFPSLRLFDRYGEAITNQFI